MRTDINVGADLCSRGAPLSMFLHSKEYLQGPCFLVNPNHDYNSMSIETIQLLKNLKQVEEEEKRIVKPSSLTFNDPGFDCSKATDDLDKENYSH